jgi:magnesium transporter
LAVVDSRGRLRPWQTRPVDGYLVGLDGASVPAERSAIEAALHDGKLLWVDLHDTGDETLALLRDVFGIHPVAIQDVAEFGQRPKVEGFGDVVYMVAYGVEGDPPTPVEVHLFYSKEFVISVHKDPCGSLEQLRLNWAKTSGEIPADRPARLVVLHHLIATLTDSYFPALSDFDDKIDGLQEQIFRKPTEDQLSDLFQMQRWLVSVRKLVTPARDAVASLVSGMVELPGMDAQGEPYLRDLYDHLIRISDLVDSYRDLLSGAMDAYLSMVSNRLNEVMRQLTIIATVFLPLSFLTGFFGQNFAWLVDRLTSLGAFLLLGIGTEILAVVGLFFLARRRGWLGQADAPPAAKHPALAKRPAAAKRTAS